MATTLSVRVGSLSPPYALELDPDDVEPGYSFAGVTAAELEVQDELGVITIWAATFAIVATKLRVTHALVANDLLKAGLLLVRAKLTGAGGALAWSRARKLLVQPKFG